MKSIIIVLLLLIGPLLAYSFTDESHYSKTFGKTRHFRVFTPPDYNPSNTSKRYPVIYYFHGCGGSYRSSGTYNYADYGLPEPVAIGRPYESDYGHPNNAEFENVAYYNDVIIISVEGKIEGMPEGCKVYFPSQADTWNDDYYNFSVYIRELIDVVDLRYNTKTGPQFRAVSGLSMGGQMAIWVAATNPHLFSSASEFCHAPNFYEVGDPAYQTTIDVQQLWRNLRGLPFRHSTNDRDYIRYYTTQLYGTYSGAGFENEYYLADFCKHHAARIDLQFGFHLNHFTKAKEKIQCFSFINLYPEFEIWGYNVSSTKTGNGWIYLHDVAKNGLGIYTRKQLPWGKSLPEFDISLTTPAIYIPNESYTLSKFSYQNNTFSSFKLEADSKGRLSINSSGGMGEEIGIIGTGLQSPVFILTDTINENIYLPEDIETPLSFNVLNLSTSPQTVDFMVSTENDELLKILNQPEQVTIPALSKISIDSFVVCKGKFLADYKNTGYIKIACSIDGIVQEREHIIQVVVKKQSPAVDVFNIKIFDGKSEDLASYKYGWREWDEPIRSDTISEGTGNGNGKAEVGETFSIWIQTPSLFEIKDSATWHPTIPINRNNNPDIVVEDIIQYRYNTGRDIFSAQMRLTRKPTKKNPVRIPIQAEFLKVQYLENDCHRNTADNFTYYFYDLVIFKNGTVVLEKSEAKANTSAKQDLQ
ncbi:MAG: hypothetical protein DRI73_08600 [Bacteroidetes bacterium]|nr:MAG: hypothetical protein DRI73_08600 [Bacteroidota bacterium]